MNNQEIANTLRAVNAALDQLDMQGRKNWNIVLGVIAANEDMIKKLEVTKSEE